MLLKKKFKAQLLQIKFFRIISSLKLAVFCLALLCILVFLGTVYQTQHGLFLAQEKFFNPWISFIGFLPIPSAKTIMSIFFINLLFALLLRFSFSWKKFGLILSHLGILLLLFSGFLIVSFSQESFLKLYEGEAKNISDDYYKWQLIHVDKYSNKTAIYDLDSLNEGFKLDERLVLDSIYKNSRLFKTPFAGDILKEMPLEKEYENNTPGLIFNKNIILEANIAKTYSDDLSLLILRRKIYKLPFSIKLLDVNRDLYPGTEIAKSYSSKILVNSNGLEREMLISMNKPFRTGLYTVFQASYGIDEDGTEYTVLAIVKNLNYSLPYLATILASLGLFIYLFQLLFNLMKLREEINA